MPAVALGLLALVLILYKPVQLQSIATNDWHVTSTNTLDMTFYDPTSGFTDDLMLKNCTLYKRFKIGIVIEDDFGNDQGVSILAEVFRDIAAAYSKAHAGSFSLEGKSFQTNAELDSHVNSWSYRDEALCFAIGWREFNVATQTFKFDLRMNYGDVLATRMPQYEYEESSQNQLYLS